MKLDLATLVEDTSRLATRSNSLCVFASADIENWQNSVAMIRDLRATGENHGNVVNSNGQIAVHGGGGEG